MQKPFTVHEKGSGTLEIFPLEPAEPFLFTLLKDIFSNYWKDIKFGILIQGAAWEIVAPNRPQHISVLDGYLTIDFGLWHFHLCIGEHKGSKKHPVEPELAAHRRTSRAEFYRVVNEQGQPTSWGLRLLNGKQEQQLTVFLPNPFLSSDGHILKEPDWSRLYLWDYLRKSYLQLDPEEKDRSATRFCCHG